jgi:hypothetical protein
MPRRRRERHARTHDWQAIQQQTLWPEQEAYERLGTQDLILDLCRIFEQRTNLRPLMRRFSALVSLFRHAYPFSRTRRL